MCYHIAYNTLTFKLRLRFPNFYNLVVIFEKNTYMKVVVSQSFLLFKQIIVVNTSKRIQLSVNFKNRNILCKFLLGNNIHYLSVVLLLIILNISVSLRY